MTSATLAWKRDEKSRFDFFKTSLGLESSKTDDHILGTPYDLKKNVEFVTYSASGLDPSDYSEFTKNCVQEICLYVQRFNGAALLLSTSYKMLNEFKNFLEQWMEEQHITMHVQTKEKSVHKLVEEFQEDKNPSVLLGTAGCWQGLDIKGDALKTVIILQIPFRADFNEPLSKARDRGMKKLGQNMFNDYAKPKAIIKLLQGAGRLVRSPTDTGAVVIFDNRLHHRAYGGSILKAFRQEYSVQVIDEEFLMARRSLMGLGP